MFDILYLIVLVSTNSVLFFSSFLILICSVFVLFLFVPFRCYPFLSELSGYSLYRAALRWTGCTLLYCTVLLSIYSRGRWRSHLRHLWEHRRSRVQRWGAGLGWVGLRLMQYAVRTRRHNGEDLDFEKEGWNAWTLLFVVNVCIPNARCWSEKYISDVKFFCSFIILYLVKSI